MADLIAEGKIGRKALGRPEHESEWRELRNCRIFADAYARAPSTNGVFTPSQVALVIGLTVAAFAGYAFMVLGEPPPAGRASTLSPDSATTQTTTQTTAQSQGHDAPTMRAAPAPAPPTLKEAKIMSATQRADTMRAFCDPSGSCDDDVLDTLVKAAPSERLALSKIVSDHERAAAAVVMQYASVLDAMIDRSLRVERKTPACMSRARREWAMLKPIDAELDKTALTVPGTGILRDVAAQAMTCVSCSSDADAKCLAAKQDLREFYKEAKQ